jgi:RNA 3'-terminal phosphate cyclase (ATP)
MSTATIEIDGSLGEGGGQILRTCLALSLITGKPFRLRNIRAGRAKPGLHAQHLMSVRAAAQIGQAKLRGASLGSCDLVFEPGKVSPGKYQFRIGTAGATSLVLHTIYLPLALSGGESTVTIEGGTHVKASPCYHFLLKTWSAYMSCLGIEVFVRLERYGFYPRGGGIIHAHINRVERVRPFQGLTTETFLATGVPRKMYLTTVVANLPSSIAPRMLKHALACLDEYVEIEPEEEIFTKGGPGCMFGVKVPTEPVPTFLFALGEKGKPAEAVADEVVDQVRTFARTKPLGVDEHSADQLLLPLALADGSSQFRVSAISSHLLTNAAVIQIFLNRQISCDGDKGESGQVTVS